MKSRGTRGGRTVFLTCHAQQKPAFSLENSTFRGQQVGTYCCLSGAKSSSAKELRGPGRARGGGQERTPTHPLARPGDQ